MRWGFPESVSPFGDQIDSIYGTILLVTFIMFVIVEVALLVFIVKYRHRDGRKAVYTHGNLRLEIIWTVIPFIGVAFLAFASAGTFLDMKRASRFPTGGMDVAIAVKQFEWNVTYPGADGRLGTADDFTKRNQLHMPVGTPVRALLTSEDVIHSFFLPEFRVKQDAVPGMEIPVWFQATRPGDFSLACAELCGTGHYRMRGSVTVHSEQEFQQWLQAEAPAAAIAAAAAPTANQGDERP